MSGLARGRLPAHSAFLGGQVSGFRASTGSSLYFLWRTQVFLCSWAIAQRRARCRATSFRSPHQSGRAHLLGAPASREVRRKASRRGDLTQQTRPPTRLIQTKKPRSDLARSFLCRAIALANFRLPKKPNSEKSEPFKPARRLRANPKPVKRCKFGWLGRAAQYKTARLPFHSMALPWHYRTP